MNEETHTGENPIFSTSKIPGGAIRDIAMGLLHVSKNVNSIFQVRVIVLDTNIILKELGYMSTHNRATALFNEAGFGLIRLLVTPSVLEEVPQKIPIYAHKARKKPEQMFLIWNEYKQKLIVIDPGKQTSKGIKLLENRDPDDVPTAQLIEVVAPTLALSADRDLSDLGYAQKGDYLPFALNARKTVERDAVLIIITSGTSTIVVGLSKGFSWIINLVKSCFRNIPKELVGIISIFSIAMIFNIRSRKWITSTITKLFPSLKQVDFSQMILTMAKKNKEWDEAEKFLSQGRPHFEAPRNMRSYVIRVLAIAPSSLDLLEIMECVKQLGYKPRGSNPEKYLIRILRKDPIFVGDKYGRWALCNPVSE